jgi:hypothetical protein
MITAGFDLQMFLNIDFVFHNAIVGKAEMSQKFMGFEPTPLIHCSTIRLALRPAP